MAASAPELSVIVPTRNRPEVLRRVVAALQAETQDHGLSPRVEIVVADDAGAPAASVSLGPLLGRDAVRCLRLERHAGAAGARNAGVEAARGAILAFLDDDIVPAPDYLRATLAFHEGHPDVLVVNGNLRPLRDDVYSRFWFHLYDATFNRAGEVYPVPMLASGHCSIKRRLLEVEVPLFDPALITREDFDLYLRLRRRGVPIYKCDRILAFNDCRATLPAFVRQYAGYADGHELLIAKHGAEIVAASQAERPIRRDWRFAHLYLLLRLARGAVRLERRLRPATRRPTTIGEVG